MELVFFRKAIMVLDLFSIAGTLVWIPLDRDEEHRVAKVHLDTNTASHGTLLESIILS